MEVAQSETMQSALQPFRQRRRGKDESPRSLAGVAGQSNTLPGNGVGDVDQLGAPSDNRLEYGREEGVMRAAENEAIAAAIKRRFKQLANAIDKGRVVEVSLLNTRRPVGAGHDVDFNIAGMQSHEIL